MTTPKLEPGTPLPCPFCGGSKVIAAMGPINNFVHCGTCGMRGPTDTMTDLQTCRYNWNTRHPDPRQREKIEALRLDVSLLARLAEDWHENSDAAKVVKRIQAALAEAK